MLRGIFFQVSNVLQTIWLKIFDFFWFKNLIFSSQTSIMVIQDLVISHLDYYNVFYMGFLFKNSQKMQQHFTWWLYNITTLRAVLVSNRLAGLFQSADDHYKLLPGIRPDYLWDQFSHCFGLLH